MSGCPPPDRGRSRSSTVTTVVVGGTIPAHDIPELQRLGVAGVCTPGAPV